jgi:vitamin B12 transporter
VETVILSKSFVRFLPLALSLPALPVYAAEPASTDADQMPVMVITASRTPQPLADVIGDVTVIDRQTLDRYQGESVLNALQVQAGVQIATNGGAGKTSSVFLRGANASQTLVLIDGVRYGSATSGSAALEHIPADQIERVEILRGPAASLYGADAIGGVIQIFTRQGHKTPQVSFSVSAGNHDTQNASISASGQVGDTRASVVIAHNKTDGFNAISNPKSSNFNPDQDGYQNDSLSVNVSHQLNRQHSFGLTLLAAQVDNQFDNGATAATNDGYNGALSLWSQHQLTDAWSARLSAASSLDKSDTEAGYVAKYKTRQDQYNIDNDVTLGNAVLSLGLERLEQRVDSNTDYDIDQRDVNSVRVGYLLNVDRIHIQANARNDDNSQFGNQTTYLAGASVDITPSLQMGASTSTGFKAPSFNDLYYPNYGHPNLKPEQSQGYEVFVSNQWNGLNTKLVGFHTIVDDLIIKGATNIGEATLKGATLTTDWQNDGYQVGFNYDYLDAKDSSDTASKGQWLARRARHTATLYAGIQQSIWQLRAEVQGQSQRQDYSYYPDKTHQLGSYAVYNLSGSVSITSDIKVGLRLNNIFDKKYALANDYAADGINGLLTLTYTPRL